jgi:uncharacterized protein
MRSVHAAAVKNSNIVMEKSNMNNKSSLILAIGIMVGLIGGGISISNGLLKMKRAERFVSVKGLAEKEVTADLAIWQLPLRSSGDDLAIVQKQIEEIQQKLILILTKNGFKPDEIESNGIRILDRKSQEYGTFEDQKQFRYSIYTSLNLRTNEVDKVYLLSQKMQELAKEGVVPTSETSCASMPSYSFTKLNDVKSEMLAEATKNARKSAEQFAADSGSKVGNIKVAYQGTFSITARDQTEDGYSSSGCANDSRNKKIRVVTTLDFFLND